LSHCSLHTHPPATPIHHVPLHDALPISPPDRGALPPGASLRRRPGWLPRWARRQEHPAHSGEGSMRPLFDDDRLGLPVPELPPGAYHVPGWLTSKQQRWLVEKFHEWASGPVPLRGAKVRGHEMSVKTVCLGWHWRPYQYTREAVDVNGNQVLDFPDWMVRLGRQALVAATGDPRAGDDYTPDTALVNHYHDRARMGMHQDKDERSPAPVVSLS